MGRTSRTSLRVMTSALALLVLLAPVAGYADDVSVRAGERNNGVRLVFEWPAAVGHSARLSGNQLKLVFDRPAETDIAGLAARVPAWVGGATRSADGREITLTLKRSAQLQSFASGTRVIVDLTPGATPAVSASPTPPVNNAAATAQPAPPASAPSQARLRESVIRTGHHAGFDRAVITLASSPNVIRNGDKVTVSALAASRLNARQLAQLRLPQVKDVAQVFSNNRLTLIITLKPGVTVQNFAVGQGIGIDFKDAPLAAPTPVPVAPVPVAAAPPEKLPVVVAEAPKVDAPEVIPVPVQETGPQLVVPAVADPAPIAAVIPPVAVPPEQAAGPEPAELVVAAPVVPETAPAVQTPVVLPVDAPLPALEMSVAAGTPMAVFMRGPSLFVVVSDKNTPRELIPLVGAALAASPRVELLPAQGGRVIRIDMAEKPVLPTITTTPTGWEIVFGATAGATTPLAIKEEPDYSLGPRLFVTAASAANPVLFADPIIGDTLAIVPVPGVATGVVNRVRTVQSELLPSYQGLVIRSWTDDLNVISTPEGVEISSISGFKLAERLAGELAQERLAQQQMGSSTPQAVPSLPPLLDFSAYDRPEAGKFNEGRVRLQDAIIAAESDSDKARAWIDLARHYFIYGMSTEAAAIWQDVAKNNADLASRPEFALMRVIAAFSSGTPDNIKAALSAVGQPTTDSSLWHGMLARAEGDFVAAAERFAPAIDRIWDYPDPYQTRLALGAIESAIETQNLLLADALLSKLNERYRMEEREIPPAVEYLTGALNWKRDQLDEARAHFGSAAQSWDQLWRARAQLALVDADIKDGRTRPVDILGRLERLRYGWRGDGLEFEILHRLARQHISMGDYAAAFEDFARMAEKYPALAQRANIVDEQKAAFVRIFQGDDRDRTPAYSQLAIWDRYPQFRPTQPSVLEDIYLYLAERVAGIDLLDRAAGFYTEVLKGTTGPAERASLGTRLAGLHLLDDKYSDAVKVLDETEPAQVANQPSVLREDAKDERRMLRARAIFGQGKPDDALALMINDYSEPATRLRADINWKTRRWNEAAATLEALIGDVPPEGQSLSAEKSGLIISRATALALAGDRTALRDLRMRFGALMAATVDADTFSLLTRPEVAGGLPDRDTLNGRMGEVDLFQKFLERYRNPASIAPESGAAVANAPAAAN